ncbi:hypothetical protein BDL97_17G026100 [Sphagnum fallax]|nr:hypothetical protein BDL97_U02500 [Sphagnum fallax]KAH8935432.1 hypothetical protein BDL97_17G026100 [Sphagnum fallax]
MAGGPKEGEICVVVDIIDGPTEEQEGGSTLNANKEREALRRIDEDPKLSRFLEEWETYLEHAPAHVESKNVNPIEVEVECLLQIENDQKLNRALTDWEKRTRSINTKNELYQLIGFYGVFQGVVLTAVAQTNLIRCSQSWGPSSLSLLASVATIASVYAKLKDYSQLRRSLEEETNDSRVWQNLIGSLKTTGADFKFPQPVESAGESKKKSAGLKLIYLWAILLSLLLFSAITLASCFVVLCNRNSSN